MLFGKVSRADLLKIIEKNLALKESANVLGYKWQDDYAPQPLDKMPFGDTGGEVWKPDEEPLLPPVPQPSTEEYYNFYVLHRIDELSEELTPEEDNEILSTLFQPEETTVFPTIALANKHEGRKRIFQWNLVKSRLHSLLAEERRGRHVDVRQVIKTISRGRQLKEIPKKAVNRQLSNIVFLGDYSTERLRPFFQDFVTLKELVCNEWGKQYLQVVDIEPHESITELLSTKFNSRLNELLPHGSVVIIASDLGLFSKRESDLLAWKAFAQFAERLSIKLIALLPVPPSFLDQSITDAFHCICLESVREIKFAPHLDAQAALNQRIDLIDKEQEVLSKDLLPALALCAHIDTKLLRYCRYLFPRCSVASEALLWTHPDVETLFGQVSLKEDKFEDYAKQYKILDDYIKEQIIASLNAYQAPYNLYREDVLISLVTMWAADPMLAITNEHLQDFVETEFINLARRLLNNKHSDENRQRKAYARAVVNELPHYFKAQHDFVSWVAALCFEANGLDDNRWINKEILQAVWGIDSSEGKRLALEIRENSLMLVNASTDSSEIIERKPRKVSQDFTVRSSALRIQKRIGSAPLLEYGVSLDKLPYEIDSTVSELRVELKDQRQLISIIGVNKPKWASEIGYDTFGLYAVIELESDGPENKIEQCFRYIDPGNFLMSDEKRLTNVEQGFWMADTACTQELWQAIMGDNPSAFQGPQRPVENVSWNDIQNEFLPRLRAQIDHDTLALPTEAQWEYACRAGTQTAFAYGNEADKDEMNFNKHVGETVEVKSKHQNHWGLWQMHGNVYEWCGDLHTEVGESRVLRGGSWNSADTGCTSAGRYGRNIVNRYNYAGFRLAIDHLSKL